MPTHSRRGSNESIASSEASPLSDGRRRSSKDDKFKRPPTPDSGSRRSTRKRSAAEFLEDDHADGDRAGSGEGTSNRDGSGSTGVCLCQPDPRIPRPRNAFILYRQHHHPGIVAQNPSLTNPEISIIIGEQWKRESEAVKSEWKTLAEEEKVRHHQQYPEYRYQPRRNSRKGSKDDSPTSATFPSTCNRCGGRTMPSPTTPNPPISASQPILPPVNPFSTPRAPYLPMVNNLTLESPRTARRNTRLPPPNISVAQMANYPDADDRFMPMSADAKRRRYTNAGAYIPTSNRPAVNSPYPVGSPYREAFQRQSFSGRTQQALPQRSMSTRQSVQGPMLPPIQNGGAEQARSVEAMVMSIPVLRKIAILGRISPPLRERGSRGAVIAVEGDDGAAVQQVVDWLEDGFKKDSGYALRVAEGPQEPPSAQELTIWDYYSCIMEWNKKGREMVDFVTSAQEDGEAMDTCKKGTPVVLLNRYQLHASNVFACRVPIKDNYSPVDHWQWMATLWRDIIGPDMTVYVKDSSAEELAKEKVVEVKEDIKCIVVRRQKGPGPLQEKVEDKNLRRLGFEIGEWIRSVGEDKGSAERRGS